MTIDSSIFWYPQLRQIKHLAWKTSTGKNTIKQKKHLPETVLSLEQLIFTRIQPVCFWEAEGSFASNGRSFIASVPNAHLEARANCRSPRTPQFTQAPYGFVWKCCVPLNPMVLLIIIPMKNGYFIGNIPNIFRQTHIFLVSLSQTVPKNCPTNCPKLDALPSFFLHIFPPPTPRSPDPPSNARPSPSKGLVWLSSA